MISIKVILLKLLSVFQRELRERVGDDDPAGAGAGQGAAVRAGGRVPHREHLLRHQDWYGTNTIIILDDYNFNGTCLIIHF